ncbi:MAG: Homoisocitrate dehydrogenase [Methanosaeta sp. PtaB.Bin018]|jgi:methanogen homoisocitrate dehydrogenase|nr:isocitrate/isopropylmalate dehydrogenase family protein [Methanothrix sp.]OPX75289.1 MAG: Homoisocitrate dehydrogenase [Methanosaeta sp. PtaB.Bin018]OPY43432.1 MAG: Homoisocitrate dehydrogenase [Methanosaeta sp. PtaU1.Bin016]
MSGEGAWKVAVVPGDGIGPEVVRSALAVLDAAGAKFEQVVVEIGFGRWKRLGLAMADEDLETIKQCDCVLLGAITTPPDPGYRSILLRLRKELDLYANIRPFRSKAIDLIIVRENTEGLYSGLEEVGAEEARTLRVVTRRGSERIAEKACEIAAKKKRLTIVHKSNVLQSDRLFLKTCQAVAMRRGIQAEEMLVDSAAYNLVVNPQRFDVIVTTNMFGDILSDEAAGVVGSLGLCASANVGMNSALFEPIHGSAPDIAGKGIANPLGAIRSAAMMMEWMGETEKATRIEAAVQWALDNDIKTPDLGGGCSTEDVTNAVADYLERS